MVGFDFFPKLSSVGELHDTCHASEEVTVICLDIPLCAQRGVASRTCVRSVCEAMPMTHSSRERTVEKLDLTSKQQQGPRQNLRKGLVIPSEDRSRYGKGID